MMRPATYHTHAKSVADSNGLNHHSSMVGRISMSSSVLSGGKRRRGLSSTSNMGRETETIYIKDVAQDT